MKEIRYTLTGEITEEKVNDLITWVNSQLYAHAIEELKLFISSKGGDMDSALRAHSFLKALPIKVTAYGFAKVDSAAITIFLAAEERRAVPDTTFLLHEGTYTVGTRKAPLHQHQEALRTITDLLDRTIKLTASVLGKDEKAIRKRFSETAILSAAEAKKLGILHSVVKILPVKKPDQTE